MATIEQVRDLLEDPPRRGGLTAGMIAHRFRAPLGEVQGILKELILEGSAERCGTYFWFKGVRKCRQR